MKEADLYGYIFDPKKPPGFQDPFVQRVGREKVGRRELRQRRAREMLGSAAPSEDEEEDENEGRGAGRRQRRATRRFDIDTAATPPKKHNGWGGARKKGVSKYAQSQSQPSIQETSETPEPEGRAAKRQKTGGNSLLHQRIQAMREESAGVTTSSGDEASMVSQEDGAMNESTYMRGGRPPGSKNTARRSDYGIKKGPRKQQVEVFPAPAANVPPTVLQSLSEGQGQFTVDPRPGTPGQISFSGGVQTPPVIAQHPVATVFQATPQPAGMPDHGIYPTQSGAPDPDTYMDTTPLSEYGNPQLDESSGTSGPINKQKQRVKSVKRSQSMTIWWAERKARQKELEEKTVSKVGIPFNSAIPTARSNSRKGARAPPSAEHHRASVHRITEHGPPEFYQAGPPIQPVPLPHEHQMQSPVHIHQSHSFSTQSHPPSSTPMLQNSPLAALPSGGPGRSTMPPLAPAPLPVHQPLNYPSPYGPRTLPRRKSSGPPPLAPAPAHISPYPPITQMGGAAQTPGTVREMPFKVMIPGPPPEHQASR